MKIYDCEVNHLTNPLGFQMEKTVFSWSVGDTQAKAQKSARLLVSRNPDLSAPEYDSGMAAAPGWWNSGCTEACRNRRNRSRRELRCTAQHSWAERKICRLSGRMGRNTDSIPKWIALTYKRHCMSYCDLQQKNGYERERDYGMCISKRLCLGRSYRGGTG